MSNTFDSNYKLLAIECIQEGTQMELGNQIKKYRMDFNWSQDELADKVFVTRQTVSNWENDKNYPDIKSLLLLSSVFGISLDTLVKGDLEEMKEQVKEADIKQLNHDSAIYAVLLLAAIISPIPLAHFLGFVGIGIWAVLMVVTLYYAIRIEKQKKKHDIQTYKEIIAFSEGKRLDEMEKNREYGKRPYQKILLAIGSGVITAAVAALMIWWLG